MNAARLDCGHRRLVNASLRVGDRVTCIRCAVVATVVEVVAP